MTDTPSADQTQPSTGTKAKRRPELQFTQDDEGKLQLETPSLRQAQELLGVENAAVAHGLLSTALNALGNSGEIYRPFIASMMSELETSDAVEAMLVTQMTATHVAITGMSQKMLDCTYTQTREAYERSLTRLSRTFLAQTEALKKHRAKAQQTVRVERVTVNDGGQAIVGDVQH